MPLLIMVQMIGYAIYGLIRGANLWPLPVLLASPLAFAYVATVAFIAIRKEERRAVRR